MATPIVVPDASVLLKWVLDSPDEEDAVAALGLMEFWLSGRCHIVLPSLWAYEVANVLASKQPELAPKLLALLLDYQFEEEEAADLYADAFTLAQQLKVSFYDASYHATALRRRGTFVTADARYVRKTGTAIGGVLHLRQWRP